MFGRNGYPVRVPGKSYYAISVTDNSYRTEQNPKFTYFFRKFLKKYNIPNFNSLDYTREISDKVLAFQRKLQKRFPYLEKMSNWIYTDIYHTGDDPLYKFRTKENSPWLTDRMIADINFPHTARYRERLVAATNADDFFIIAIEKKSLALSREILYKKVYEGQLLVEETFGGFISHNNTEPHFLRELVDARNLKDYKKSDEIKAQFPMIEFQFTNTGIFWFNK